MTIARSRVWQYIGVIAGLVFGVLPRAGAEELQQTVLPAPPGYFSQPDPKDPKGNPIAQPGVKRITGDTERPIFDVREFFETHGVTFPAGAEARYYSDASALFLRNTKANLDLSEALLQGPGPCGNMFLLMELTLAKFAIAPDEIPAVSGNYYKLRKAAGDSWREVATLTSVAKSGRRSVLSSLKAVNSPAAAPQLETKDLELPKGRDGASCILENVVGPDGVTIDVDVAYVYRGTPPGEEEPIELRFTGQSVLRDGYPRILQFSAAAAGNGDEDAKKKVTGYVLVLRARTEVLEAGPFEPRPK